MENTGKYKFVAVINRQLPSGVALNAIAHMSAGIVASASPEIKEQMCFIDFIDKNEIQYKSISANSLIVLSGKPGEIKKVYSHLIEKGILIVSFLETMTNDTYKEQLERTRNTPTEDVLFYGIMIFGEKAEIDPITRKLSLWK